MSSFKEFSFYISTCVGLAISTSAFTVISGVFKLVDGIWLAFTLLLGGLFCLVISNSVAVLASVYTTSPGVRTYLKKAFGDKASLFFVALYLMFIVLVGSVESSMFSTILNMFVDDVPPIFIAAVMLSLVVFVNCYGLELPKNVQIITATTLFLGLLTLGITGITVAPNGLQQITDSLSQTEQLAMLPAAVGIAIFLFVGFEWVTPLGFNKEAYKRKIPNSMPLAICLNFVMFSLFVVGLHLNVSRELITSTSTPQIQFAINVFGQVGAYLMLILSCLAIISTFNAGVMGGARFLYALGREGHLPRWTTKISYSSGAPIGAIMTLGALVFIGSCFVITLELELVLAILSSAIVCFVYMMLMAALVKLERGNTDFSPTFVSRVPRPVQYLIILLLPALGVMSLLSIPELATSTSIGFFVAAALGLLFVITSSRQKTQASAVKRKAS